MMNMHALIGFLLVASAHLGRVCAASAEQWRGRSIYQSVPIPSHFQKVA
jgi:hypothetical protein